MSDIVRDAHAMLMLFAKSPWRDLHIRTADGELFWAKPGGAANPMAALAVAAAVPIITATARAPHLASVVSVERKGAAVAAGATVAVLELLGETFDVASPEAGQIASVDVAPGDLVEFDQALVSIAA